MQVNIRQISALATTILVLRPSPFDGLAAIGYTSSKHNVSWEYTCE
jgi:hypothetical protein